MKTMIFIIINFLINYIAIAFLKYINQYNFISFLVGIITMGVISIMFSYIGGSKYVKNKR